MRTLRCSKSVYSLRAYMLQIVQLMSGVIEVYLPTDGVGLCQLYRILPFSLASWLDDLPHCLPATAVPYPRAR